LELREKRKAAGMADKDKAGNPNTYAIKPHFRKKFQPMKVEEIIKTELREKLENEKYHVDKAAKQAREITDSIKKSLKGTTSGCCPPSTPCLSGPCQHAPPHPAPANPKP